MFQALPIRRRITKLFIPALVILFSLNETMAQCGYASLKQQRITGLNIGGGMYTGLLQWLPADYDTNPSKIYPVIIFLHGLGGVHSGPSTPDDLCKIFTDQSDALPNRIERNEFPTSVTVNGQSYSYIVISPQFSQYQDPFLYGDQTDALIDYVVANYRVDPARIYLTGLSAGASLVMDYISSSAQRAQRVAAASFASVCFATSRAPASAPANIASSGLATWFVHCETDANYGCVIGIDEGWVNGINSNNPTVPARFSRQTANPGLFGDASLPYCQGWEHNSWTALYHPNFVPLDGQPNFYTWNLQYQAESALPVTLKSFTARLSNGKVYLRWVTSSEQENAGFIIERAGGTGSYSSLSQVGGGGSTSGDKVYEYVDENPLTNLSFYRLKQLDLNGRTRVFETRKVMNKSRYKSMVLITPNPFTSDPSAFVTIDKRQRISVWLTDMSGRVLSTVNNTFEEGTSELSLPMGNLPRGVYFVKVKGENITETHKIIKQ